MHKATKSLMKELIEFYEGCGRDRRKTTSYFVTTKKESNQKISKLLTKYIRQGSSILEIQGKRKGRRYLQPIALETSKKVLNLLQQDPTITTAEGAEIVGISRRGFSKHRDRLMTPGRLTTEMKIQLGIIPPPPEDEFLPSTSNAKLEVATDSKDCHNENYIDNMDNAEDNLQSFQFGDSSNDNEFQNDEECKTEPTTPHSKSGRHSRKTFKHCLLCYVRLDSKIESGKKMTQSGGLPITNPLPSILNDDDGEGKLGENLNVIFALKSIFGLEASDLIKFMKASNGKDPRGWYHLCSECDGVMKEAVAIQRQILQLTRELENCKSRIQGKVKESCGKGLGRRKAGDVSDDLLVTKLIRESVCPRKKRRKKVKKSDDGTVEVKTEPMDQDNFNESPGDHESFWKNDAEHAPNGEIVAPSSGFVVNVNQSSSTERKLSSIVGINQSGIDLGDLKMKPKLVICELCGEEMRRFSLPVHTLRIHDILMDGYTEYKCTESGCQYRTVNKLNFKDHMKHVHIPLKQGRKYSCQFCGKKFKCNNHLRTHLTIHTNAESKPYQCEICGRGFAVYGSLWSHVKGVHQGWVSPFRKRLMARKKEKLL